MTEKKNKKNPSLGCLFWIAFILLIIVIFFFNKANISTALENTGAKELLNKNTKGTELTSTNQNQVLPKINTQQDSVTVTEDRSAKTSGDGSKEIEPAKPDTTATVPEVKTPDAKNTDAKNQAIKKPDAKTTKTAPTSTDKTSEPTAKKTTKQSVQKTPAIPSRKASLYFVSIDADGKVIREEVTREITQTDSPLSETINVLLKGTSSAESGKGLRSLIPEGTRLLSATVKDGVATINLSDEFQFNQFGIEGYLGQLAQIVFTATSFPTVKSVQFLVEGQRHEYLGAEGVWIGTPLDRDKF